MICICSLQPSSTTQLLALSLLRFWGHSEFLAHCKRVALFYLQKRTLFAAAAGRHLKGKANWELPAAGMFFYLTLLLPPGLDSFDVISNKGVASGVLAVPGVAFMPCRGRTCQVRVSISLLTEDDAEEACRRIAVLVDSTWKS
jgi:tryptophan aminotransferase